MTSVMPALDVRRATNMFGPLDAETRTRLQALIDKPSQRSWDDAHSIIVFGEKFITMWQAVLHVDPGFPRHKDGKRWAQIPTREVVLQALHAAVNGEVTRS